MVHELSVDITIVGAGPAGLAAAAAASKVGASVLVIDADHSLGGQIWRAVGGVSARPVERLRTQWNERGVQHLPGSAVIDAPSPQSLIATTPDGVVRIATKRLVLATGARELWIPFLGATDPHIAGAGGLQALVKGGLSVRGARVLVAGSGPLLWPVAARLKAGGARVLGLVEQASRGSVAGFGLRLARSPKKIGGLLGSLAALAAVPKRFGSWVERAEPSADGLMVTIATADGARSIVVCDRLAVGYGLVPDLRLATVLGLSDGRTAAIAVDAHQETALPGVFAAGEITGVGGVDKALIEGEIAGLSAVGMPVPRSLSAARDRQWRFAADLARTFALRPEIRVAAAAEAVLCRCESVDVGAAVACPDARSAKLLTRCGMGACQGRVCGPALGYLRGFADGSVRPPLVPTTVGDLADAWSPAETIKV